DAAAESKAANAVREMLVEKGFQDAKVEPTLEAVEGAPKTVNLTFRITEGPRVKITDVAFVGNKVFSSSELKSKMKFNKDGGFLCVGGAGTYQETKFEEDADRIVAHYFEPGYIDASVGKPALRKIRDSSDGKGRYMLLEIPIHEGPRYRVADLT